MTPPPRRHRPKLPFLENRAEKEETLRHLPHPMAVVQNDGGEPEPGQLCHGWGQQWVGRGAVIITSLAIIRKDGLNKFFLLSAQD